jgi:hypothetical protein
MKKVFFVALVFVLCASFIIIAQAHPGRTDGKGGHYNRSTGEYHYHHGYSEHDHYDMDGDGDKDCPYTYKKSDYDAPAKEITIPKIEFETLPEIETIPKYLVNYNKTTYNPTNAYTEKESIGIADDIIALAVCLFAGAGVSMFFLPKCAEQWGDKKGCLVSAGISFGIGIFAFIIYLFSTH